jgi:hypothetical protein
MYVVCALYSQNILYSADISVRTWATIKNQPYNIPCVRDAVEVLQWS